MKRVSFAAMALLLAAETSAQQRLSYSGVIATYRSGDVGRAVATLRDWPPDAVEPIVKSALAAGALTTKEMVAAAVLHSQTALSMIDLNPIRAGVHTDLARRLLAAGRDAASKNDDRAERQRLDAVLRRWYYFTATAFASAGQQQLALFYVRQGFSDFKNDPMLFVAEGTIAEMVVRRGGLFHPRRPLPSDSRQRGRLETELKNVIDHYQHALHVDPNLAVAHLRIGWIRLYLRDAGAAASLEAAASAGSDSVRYLARVFLGEIAERAGKFDDAKRHYEVALAAGSGPQTAYVALSRVEDALGHTARARELALSGARAKEPGADPWWDFQQYFDRDTLAWLQMEALRP